MKRFLNTLALSAATALALSANSVAAQDVALQGVTLAIGDGSEPIENATVIIRDGKVLAVGTNLATPDAITMEVPEGSWVTPGIVAAVTNLGLWDVGAVSESNDSRINDSSPFGPALDVAPAINPGSQHVAISRAGGVTRAAVVGMPTDSIFTGQGAVIDLGADAQPITQARAFQGVMIGERGARIAGGSRIATHVTLRNAIAEASAYAAGRWEGEEALLTRVDAAALGPVIAGRQKLFVHAERASDIRQVIALKREFPRLDIVITGASEGWTLASEIAASGIPVIASSLQDLPERFEQLASTQSNIGRMTRAGVKVAIDASSMRQPRQLAQHAGNLVALTRIPRASGLTWGQALAAITSVPADILGMKGKFGTLSRGAAGDLVIWDGDPLEVSSAPTNVFIDGVEQPLGNHQSRLRERYRDLDETALPKAYDW
ncbi:amidohydrolase family protein [Qipengyuania sp. DGS5-3]|uniref:amidohydrolase family protein n=1 Tax=Qipengyuania sp. DGS5-3 TaxID=3349632 RepID=UPI0036D40FFB